MGNLRNDAKKGEKRTLIRKLYKTVKLDAGTHRRLKIYAAQRGMSLGDAVKELLDRAGEKDQRYI